MTSDALREQDLVENDCYFWTRMEPSRATEGVFDNRSYATLSFKQLRLSRLYMCWRSKA
jgi:hypothetical protein